MRLAKDEGRPPPKLVRETFMAKILPVSASRLAWPLLGLASPSSSILLASTHPPPTLLLALDSPREHANKRQGLLTFTYVAVDHARLLDVTAYRLEKMRRKIRDKIDVKETTINYGEPPACTQCTAEALPRSCVLPYSCLFF